MKDRVTISVIGVGEIRHPPLAGLAYDVGYACARRGLNLVCGGLDGVMAHACRGHRAARDEGITTDVPVTIGILPGEEPRTANPFVDVVIPSGLGVARNALVIRSGQAVVAVGGGAGTLSELAMAWQLGRPIAVVHESGGWAQRLAGQALDDRRGDTIQVADADAAVQWCLERVTGTR